MYRVIEVYTTDEPYVKSIFADIMYENEWLCHYK